MKTFTSASECASTRRGLIFQERRSSFLPRNSSMSSPLFRNVSSLMRLTIPLILPSRLSPSIRFPKATFKGNPSFRFSFWKAPPARNRPKGFRSFWNACFRKVRQNPFWRSSEKKSWRPPPRHGALLVTSRGRPFLEAGTTGIRTTHLGCDPSLRKALEENLDHFLAKPNHRFIDALVLASKVLASESVLLEICVSDDPSYTTGYMASRLFGYVRIPHMKKPGIPKGGRLYVVSPTVHLPTLLRELRETPVLFDGQSSERIIKAHSRLKPIPSAEIRPPSQGTPR